MRKTIGIALVLLLACSVMASADATNWILSIKGTDTSGMRSGDTLRVGWYTGKTDGLDTGEEANPPAPAPGASLVDVVALGTFYADGMGIIDYRAPLSLSPTLPKTWSVAVWYVDNNGGPINPMQLTFTPTATATFPYAQALLRISVPAAGYDHTYATGDELTSLVLNIPGKGTPGTLENPDIIVQALPIPEPGSLLALGSGLVGLVGFAIRRRRS